MREKINVEEKINVVLQFLLCFVIDSKSPMIVFSQVITSRKETM